MLQFIGVPIDRFLQKYACTRTTIHSVAVYFYKEEEKEDLELGRQLFREAMDLVQTMEPSLLSQAPQYIKSVMVCTIARDWVFTSADKCCRVNPWSVYRKCDDLQLAKKFLAAGIVGMIVFAKLSSGSRGIAGIVHRTEIAQRTTIRFLEKLHELDWDFEIKKMIELWKEQR